MHRQVQVVQRVVTVGKQAERVEMAGPVMGPMVTRTVVQQAQVRVDAFPYTQFGSIPAVIKAVSVYPLPPDQQNPEPRFPGYVRLERNYLERDGRQYRIGSGQSVQANVVLRQKRVITLLTDVLDRAFDSLRRIRSTSAP